MIADHRRNLGRVGKIETLPILQICPRSSQTIGDIYDFEFSLIGKIWDGPQGALTSYLYRAYVVFCGGHFEFLIRAWSADARSGTEI